MKKIACTIFSVFVIAQLFCAPDVPYPFSRVKDEPVEETPASAETPAEIVEPPASAETPAEIVEPQVVVEEGWDETASLYAANAYKAVYEAYKGLLDMEGATTYTVKWGDTLMSVSRMVYGEGKDYYFPLIALASLEKQFFYDADAVLPRVKLTIPDYEANVCDPDICAGLKDLFTELSELYAKNNSFFKTEAEGLRNVTKILTKYVGEDTSPESDGSFGKEKELDDYYNDTMPIDSYVFTPFKIIYDSFDGLVKMDGAETYEVKWGDTLTSVSEKVYNEEQYCYPLIILGSKKLICDPNVPLPKMTLKVPSPEANFNDTESMPKFRKLFNELTELYGQRATSYELAAAAFENIANTIEDEVYEYDYDEESDEDEDEEVDEAEEIAEVAVEEINADSTEEIAEAETEEEEIVEANVTSGIGKINNVRKSSGDSFSSSCEAYSDILNMKDARSYTVKWGDTLNVISRDSYGANGGRYFPLILLASRDVVTDPDNLSSGMKLTIPDLELNLNDKDIRSELKDFYKELSDLYRKKSQSYARDTARLLFETAETF